MEKKRSFLHLATMVFVLGLWSCSSPHWPRPTKLEFDKRHHLLQEYLNEVQVTVEPAQLKTRRWEVPFYPSFSERCPSLTAWTSQCEKERQLPYPTFLNRWLPYIIEYPPNEAQNGGFALSFQQMGLNGLLYLYPSETPRPLYIVRGGIGSRYDSFYVERPLLMTLIYHLKAHVLFIGSSVNDVTLSQFQFENSGPLADYYHNHQLLKIFSQPGLKPLISSINLITISMSGLGGYLSTNFDPLGNPSQFDRVYLLCPFLNYPLKAPEINRFWYYQLTKSWAIRRFRRTLAQLNRTGLDEHPLKPLFEQLEQVQSEKIKKDGYPELTHFLDGVGVNAIEKQPWTLTTISRTLLQKWKPKSPVYLLLSRIDPIVHPESNGALIADAVTMSTWFERGFHCQFYLAYPTQSISEFFGD